MYTLYTETLRTQDYAQKPQRNCTFMNSVSGLKGFGVVHWILFSVVSVTVTMCARKEVLLFMLQREKMKGSVEGFQVALSAQVGCM
jgi:hypothetical protein